MRPLRMQLRFTVASTGQRIQGHGSILAIYAPRLQIRSSCPHSSDLQPDVAMKVQYIVFLTLMAAASAKAWYLVAFTDNDLDFQPLSRSWQPAAVDLEDSSKKSQTTKTDEDNGQEQREETRRRFFRYDWSDEDSRSDEDSNSDGD
ncbi:uncharacterized protein LOC122253757 [Penaeus japonicus]|uniref:uncharacterized protein LOC122253757 n=1 Tax=Penaeus japonicus TaxID=27405 RepID=UPI001C712F62|nr:uncharacterized protein LOC122253757 [Penaeus japonicus]